MKLQEKSKSLFDFLPNADPSDVNQVLHRLDDEARLAFRTLAFGNGKVSSGPASCVICFSGGIDSSILASLVSDELSKDLPLLRVGTMSSQDANAVATSFATQAVSRLDEAIVEQAVLAVSSLAKPLSLSHFEDCVAFWVIAREVRERFKGARYILSANGPDELFCGYDRFRRIADTSGYKAVSEEIHRAVSIAKILAQQVRVILSSIGIELLNPFLSEEFVRFCELGVPVKYKIAIGDDRLRKRIWRLYGRKLGLAEEVVQKPKKAMQYSMGIHAVVKRMLKKGKLEIGLQNAEMEHRTSNA
ncbi:MAG TPA: asparagine synthase C-terminal domain-containing protein [Nitrososphaerales archaeon]|nr:asparagine synthase C-terminal domain-containing protein [Nitrososphaerales archaeon]